MTFWKRYRKRLIIATLVFGVLVVGLRLTLLAPYRVESVSLEPHDVQREAFGVGTVEARVVVSVGSKITGRVTALNVDQGDRVRKGQLLATGRMCGLHPRNVYFVALSPTRGHLPLNG